MVRASGGREEGGRIQKEARKEKSRGNRDSVSRTQEKKENAPRTCARARLVPRRLSEAAPRRLRSIISLEIECCCREWPLRVTKGTKVAENFCSLDCKPITPSRGNPLCVRRERSVAARAHVFLTLPAKWLVMVAGAYLLGAARYRLL
jgi:hypothetical protein